MYLKYDITVADSFVSFKIKFQNDVWFILSQMLYCRRKSFEYLNSPKFQFVTRIAKIKWLMFQNLQKIAKLKYR